MNIRHPVRAGSFYEASPSSCTLHATKLLDGAEVPDDLPQRVFGGIVPHAGWMYSGHLAALTFKALAARPPVRTIVLLGADHTGSARVGEVYDSGVWRTPLGEAAVDSEVASALISAGTTMRSNPRAHGEEHSIEVQVPLIQAMDAGIRIVPVLVPPLPQAMEIGRTIGTVLAERFPDARVIASTDLTHHGGHFPAPGGHGATGVRWSEENDRRMIDLVTSLADERIVPEADARGNACGAGAMAAAIAACRQMGASRGLLLGYTNSYRVIHRLYPEETDETTVGYASVVFA